MLPITPVILCGGTGTRLWPLSRKSYPKQFSRILGEESLFQQSARRLSGDGGPIAFAPPVVMTHADFRFIVTEQLFELGINPRQVMIEPVGRNTAPAVLSAALICAAEDLDAMLLIAPSDHWLPDTAAFHAAVATGYAAAEAGRVVTFGIMPDHPETGFGYLELDRQVAGLTEPAPLLRFVEKPAAAAVAEMLATGRYLWNAGIFLTTARTLIEAFDRLAPEILAPVRLALAEARPDLGFLRLAAEPWCVLPSVSIDVAVMEKLSMLSVVPLDFGWNDMGSWKAVMQAGGADTRGVVTSGPVLAVDCDRTLLRSEDPGLQLVGLGLADLVVVAMPDAVLVADARRTQEVKEVVARLNADNVHQSGSFPQEHRPWGSFTSLVRSALFQVKQIVVKPGAALSLQSHRYRAEHWVVVSGTARVTIGDHVRLIGENESVFVPLGTRHRLENPGLEPMTLIEVQTGSYFGEDDIVRYQDNYARTQET